MLSISGVLLYHVCGSIDEFANVVSVWSKTYLVRKVCYS